MDVGRKRRAAPSAASAAGDSKRPKLGPSSSVFSAQAAAAAAALPPRRSLRSNGLVDSSGEAGPRAAAQPRLGAPSVGGPAALALVSRQTAAGPARTAGDGQPKLGARYAAAGSSSSSSSASDSNLKSGGDDYAGSAAPEVALTLGAALVARHSKPSAAAVGLSRSSNNGNSSSSSSGSSSSGGSRAPAVGGAAGSKSAPGSAPASASSADNDPSVTVSTRGLNSTALSASTITSCAASLPGSTGGGGFSPTNPPSPAPASPAAVPAGADWEAVYANEIYAHQLQLERERTPGPGWMAGQPFINTRMRAILLDWIVLVAHKYKQTPETLYRTVMLIDKYLATAVVERHRLQLAGVAAMLLASKYEEVCGREVTAEMMSHMCAGAYTQAEVLDYERRILAALRFSVTLPTPYTFLPRFLGAFAPAVAGAAAAAPAPPAPAGAPHEAAPSGSGALRLACAAQYVLEKTLLDLDVCGCHLPSALAGGAALVAAERLLGPLVAASCCGALAAACGPAVPWYRVLAARDAVAAVASGTRVLNPALTAVRDKFMAARYHSVALAVDAAGAPAAAAEAAVAGRGGAAGAPAPASGEPAVGAPAAAAAVPS